MYCWFYSLDIWCDSPNNDQDDGNYRFFWFRLLNVNRILPTIDRKEISISMNDKASL